MNEGGHDDGDRRGEKEKEEWCISATAPTSVTHYCPLMSNITVFIHSGKNMSAASDAMRTFMALNIWSCYCCFCCCRTAVSFSYLIWLCVFFFIYLSSSHGRAQRALRLPPPAALVGVPGQHYGAVHRDDEPGTGWWAKCFPLCLPPPVPLLLSFCLLQVWG